MCGSLEGSTPTFACRCAGVYGQCHEALTREALLLAYVCRTKRWRAFASGAVAGPTLLLTGPKARHTSLAIYILIRCSGGGV